MKHKVCLVTTYSCLYLLAAGVILSLVTNSKPLGIMFLIVGLVTFVVAFILINRGYLVE